MIPSFESRSGLSKALFAAAVGYVLKVKLLHSSMKSVPQPWDWFRIQPHVNDFLASKFLCMTSGGNARQGNRFPNYGMKYDCCPNCEHRGVTVKLNEAHVIFSCLAVSGQRLGLGLSAYKAAPWARV